MRFAGFWVRTAACVIDTLIVLIIVLPAMLFFEDRYQSVIQFSVGFFYETYLISSKHQATFGKRCFGLRVINLDYSRITFAKSIGRYFGKLLSSITFFVGFLMIAFSKRKQGLHDYLGNTAVIFEKNSCIEQQSPESQFAVSSSGQREEGWVLAGFDASGYVLRFRFALGDERLYQPRGLTIGRGELESDFIISDSSVSRSHARLVAFENHIYIEDVGSRNGTYVGDEQIHVGLRHKIVGDQEIRFGEVVFSIGRE